MEKKWTDTIWLVVQTVIVSFCLETHTHTQFHEITHWKNKCIDNCVLRGTQLWLSQAIVWTIIVCLEIGFTDKCPVFILSLILIFFLFSYITIHTLPFFSNCFHFQFLSQRYWRTIFLNAYLRRSIFQANQELHIASLWFQAICLKFIQSFETTIGITRPCSTSWYSKKFSKLHFKHKKYSELKGTRMNGRTGELHWNDTTNNFNKPF